jgi:tRNA pseudouridine55 synthase
MMQPKPNPANRSKRPRPAPLTCDGLILVDKPADWTSHDVVAKIRSRFHVKKVGHGGTLDPMATGLLVILLGRGTKMSDRVMGSDKTYEGVMELGKETDTHDVDGEVVAEHDASGITEEQLREEAAGRVGDILQVPPMVSAIKKDGVPLYKLARKGQTVEREPRLRHIYEFTILDAPLPEARFRVKCTKGTYVRTLCHDLGQSLGCGAHLKALRRTRSGGFNVEDALPLQDVVAMTPEAFVAATLSLHQLATELLP